MASFLKPYFNLNNLICFLALLFISGCASMQQPGGGPKDKTPPKIVKESPKNLTKNFSSKEIEIEFDEFIKPLQNEFKEVGISPSPNRRPIFKVRKNILYIKFQDSLEKNTTYTINFGKSIVDFNEGNILRKYNYVFSTGNIIDSLSISGNVIQLLSGKPEIDIPVFIIPIKQDSIFGKKAANIYTATDSSGNFVFRNLKADTYRIYALKEQSGDRIYNSINEEIAFQADSIVLTKNVTDIKLKTFKQDPAVFTTIENRLEGDGRIFLKFNQAITNPSLKILKPEDLDKNKKVEFSAKGDSAYLWLPEITFDSLIVAIQDKGLGLDTVRIRKDKVNRVLTIKDNINYGINTSRPLILTFTSPVEKVDLAKISVLDDTLKVRGFQVVQDTPSLRKYKLIYPWKSGHIYTLRVEENAFSGAYGANKYYTNKFRPSGADNNANLTLNIAAPNTGNYIVQLLRNETDVVQTREITSNTALNFPNIAFAKYNVRIIYDANANGKWDTGNVKQKRQPEKIWNYEMPITLKPPLDSVVSIVVPKDP